MLFSRIALKPGSGLSALLSDRLDAYEAHRLLWTLFADDTDRDFVYRMERSRRRPTFMVVSARPPVDAHDLFEIETKDYRPALAAGDRLSFAARLNPVRRKGKEGRDGRSKKVDVVMDDLRAWRETPAAADQAPDRLALAHGAVGDWLAVQGSKRGFELDRSTFAVSAYEVLRFRTSGHANGGARHGVTVGAADVEGRLTVTDPDRFETVLFRGLGSAKAFGCGLVMVRRG